MAECLVFLATGSKGLNLCGQSIGSSYWLYKALPHFWWANVLYVQPVYQTIVCIAVLLVQYTGPGSPTEGRCGALENPLSNALSTLEKGIEKGMERQQSKISLAINGKHVAFRMNAQPTSPDTI